MFSNPRCEIAVNPRHGVYAVNGDDTVSLKYDDGGTATFIIQTNCRGTDRLVGPDYGGETLTLTH